MTNDTIFSNETFSILARVADGGLHKRELSEELAEVAVADALLSIGRALQTAR